MFGNINVLVKVELGAQLHFLNSQHVAIANVECVPHLAVCAFSDEAALLPFDLITLQ